jgi:hypothetical protein
MEAQAGESHPGNVARYCDRESEEAVIHDFDPSWDFKPTKPAPSYWEWADSLQMHKRKRETFIGEFWCYENTITGRVDVDNLTDGSFTFNPEPR